MNLHDFSSCYRLCLQIPCYMVLFYCFKEHSDVKKIKKQRNDSMNNNWSKQLRKTPCLM